MGAACLRCRAVPPGAVCRGIAVCSSALACGRAVSPAVVCRGRVVFFLLVLAIAAAAAALAARALRGLSLRVPCLSLPLCAAARVSCLARLNMALPVLASAGRRPVRFLKGFRALPAGRGRLPRCALLSWVGCRCLPPGGCRCRPAAAARLSRRRLWSRLFCCLRLLALGLAAPCLWLRYSPSVLLWF